MFSPDTYQNRRKALSETIEDGIIFLPGNIPVPMNYPSNHLRFRQDSNLLYFCGLDFPNLNLVMDTGSGDSTLFGDDLTVDDIVWEGDRISIKEMAGLAGINHFRPNKDLSKDLKTKKQTIHYLPQYRADQKNLIDQLFNGKGSSKNLIQSVIRQRSIKTEEEIIEIDQGMVVTAEMHKLAMMLTRPGAKEQTIVGQIEGFALSYGRRLAYPVIFSVRGEILHNNQYNNTLESGQLVLNDSGAESPMHYASDITRTFPVNGKFNKRQKAIYHIVNEMQFEAFNYCKPGKSYKDAHLKVASIAVEGLKSLGLMKGKVEDAVATGAHALFFPHGLGHMMGLDVHDMEGLGEDLVGYDHKKDRSDQFGLAYLRLAKELEPGFVLTVEPGLYFIPHLIDQWKADKKNNDFINYDKLDSYRDFGGIRIEDNIIITNEGYRILGPPIPKTIDEIEGLMEDNA